MTIEELLEGIPDDHKAKAKEIVTSTIRQFERSAMLVGKKEIAIIAHAIAVIFETTAQRAKD